MYVSILLLLFTCLGAAADDGYNQHFGELAKCAEASGMGAGDWKIIASAGPSNPEKKQFHYYRCGNGGCTDICNIDKNNGPGQIQMLDDRAPKHYQYLSGVSGCTKSNIYASLKPFENSLLDTLERGSIGNSDPAQVVAACQGIPGSSRALATISNSIKKEPAPPAAPPAVAPQPPPVSEAGAGAPPAPTAAAVGTPPTAPK